MPFSKLELGLLALETSVFFAHNVQQGLLGLQDFDEGAFGFGDGLVVISFSDVLLLERGLDLLESLVQDADLLFDLVLLLFFLLDDHFDVVLVLLDPFDNFNEFLVSLAQ